MKWQKRIVVILISNRRIFKEKAEKLNGLPGSLSGKQFTCNAMPGSGRFPWRRKWQSTPVFLPGKSHGQRSLAGYCLWGCRESDTIEWLKNKTAQVILSHWLPSAPESSCPLGMTELRNLGCASASCLSLGGCCPLTLGLFCDFLPPYPQSFCGERSVEKNLQVLLNSSCIFVSNRFSTFITNHIWPLAIHWKIWLDS